MEAIRHRTPGVRKVGVGLRPHSGTGSDEPPTRDVFRWSWKLRSPPAGREAHHRTGAYAGRHQATQKNGPPTTGKRRGHARTRETGDRSNDSDHPRKSACLTLGMRSAANQIVMLNALRTAHHGPDTDHEASTVLVGTRSERDPVDDRRSQVTHRCRDSPHAAPVTRGANRALVWRTCRFYVSGLGGRGLAECGGLLGRRRRRP